MPLEPTEREEHFFKAMVDAADGNTPEELEPTERKEHWYKEIIDAINTGGGGGSGGGVLVVTITHSNEGQSYTDVADKTAGELLNAYPLVLVKTIDNTLPIPGGAISYSWAMNNGDPYEDDGVYCFPWGSRDSKPLEAATLNDYPTVTWTDK